MISPHSPKRVYFAANRLYRSDDRGDSWAAVSGDITRRIDRNSLEVMGKVWGPDAVFKSGSTSLYGNCVAMAESPGKEGLLYVGTDDGLIQVTMDGGRNWRKVEAFPGVPANTYVSKLVASRHDAATVYACFDNHKNGDFTPYLLKSTDAGGTWAGVAGDLPGRGTVYCLAEDHIDPDLLFCGTEFGVFVTLDGGKKWHHLRNGLPTIQVKDLCIQRKMDDLIVGTFGRGIYVIDDYSSLRNVKLSTDTPVIYPVRDSLLYIESSRLGGPGKGFRGASFYTADNPPYGATFTYTLTESLKTLKQKRKDAEKEAEKARKPVPYPTPDELRAEAEEEPPAVFLEVSDAGRNVVRTLTGATGEGMHRATWDLTSLGVSERGSGPLVAPGKYSVRLFKREAGNVTPLAGPVTFDVVLDPELGVTPEDVRAQVAFHKEVQELLRAVTAAAAVANDLTGKLDDIRAALDVAPKADAASRAKVRELIATNRDIVRALRGDRVLRERNENTPDSITERVGYAFQSSARILAKPTGTQREAYEAASKEFATELAKLRTLVETDVPALEKKLDAFGAPLTPGRLPVWGKK